MTAADTARSASESTGAPLARPHFPGFESLRALAAVMVVVHHAASLSGPTRAGRLATPAAVMDGGVAVFFVLSGFLIYRPFVTAHLASRPGPTWRSFWWRRVLRIVPAYWVVLTFFWALGSYELGDDWWRYYLLLQIYSPFTALGGVVQSWSLATEMSFYLVVPLVAGLVARSSRRAEPARRVTLQLAACAVLWTGGFVSRYVVDRWVSEEYRGIAFNWLPTNLDLFATGMAVAVVSAWAMSHPATRDRLDRLATPVAPWWAAAGALFLWYAYRVGAVDFETGYAGWYWHRRQLVLGVVTLLLMVPAVFGPQDHGLLRRAWSWTPLVWVGTVSYGLYLWHLDWMERAVAGPEWSGWLDQPRQDASFVALLVIGLGTGLASAAVSWYGLERPLQRWKHLLDRRTPAGVGHG